MSASVLTLLVQTRGFDPVGKIRVLGYLVGVDTPTAQEAALLQKLAEEFGDAPATTHTEDIVRQRREQQAD
jgi:hypothetical protein